MSCFQEPKTKKKEKDIARNSLPLGIK